MAETIITVNDLTKTFRLKQKAPGLVNSLKNIVHANYREVVAVDNLNFTVQRGELLAFIGPNGAGKSTTIKMLTGILYPTSGKINILGLNPSRQRQKLAYYIGSVFGQKPQLWYHLPAQDTYNLFSRIYELEPREYEQRLQFLIDAFEISDLINTPVRKLSLGQRMRCEIVASLLHRPQVVFLDEPTIGLDVIAKQKIREVIKYLNEKEQVTIFLTSHDAGDIETLAKRTIVINHGQMVFDDSTEQFKKNFIQTKAVELVLADGTDKFQFPGGGRVIEQTKYTIKIELDTATSAQSIDKLLNYAVDNFQIQDINISDPPMEEIIADIYRQQQKWPTL